MQYLPSSSWEFKKKKYIQHPETADKTIMLSNHYNVPLKKIAVRFPSTDNSLIFIIHSLCQRVCCSLYWSSVPKWTICNFLKEFPWKPDLDGSKSKYHWYCTCHRKTNNICAWMWSRHCFMEKQCSQDHHKSTWCLRVPDFMFTSWSQLKQVENHK